MVKIYCDRCRKELAARSQTFTDMDISIAKHHISREYVLNEPGILLEPLSRYIGPHITLCESCYEQFVDWYHSIDNPSETDEK